MSDPLYHSPTAPKWRFWLARLFGKQVKAVDGICTLYGYRLLGRIYVVRVEIKP